MEWFKIEKGVCQDWILSPCLFNSYAEYIMWNAGLDKAQAGIKIANNIRYADNITLMAESEEELRSLLMKVKVAPLCLTLCDPMDYTDHGILQARILEWVAFPFSRESSQLRDQTQVSLIAYLRLLIFLLAILIPACALSSLAFHTMYSEIE